jgi:hypothetical protein
LVDTPGLFDLGSPEIDVSNQLGIAKALAQAKSVLPVIILSYKKFGARGESIKIILNFYAQMITDSEIIERFNFFFTHVDEGMGMKQIAAIFNDILDKLTQRERDNERLVKFLEVIIDKADSDKLFILNPIDKNILPLQILNSLTSSRKITSPSDVFMENILAESKSKINE